MLKFIHENLRIPVITDGYITRERIIARLVIAEDGLIEDVEITQSVSPEMDKETIRLIKSMPKWIPGKQNGRTVKTYYTIPIVFRLQNIE